MYSLSWDVQQLRLDNFLKEVVASVRTVVLEIRADTLRDPASPDSIDITMDEFFEYFKEYYPQAEIVPTGGSMEVIVVPFDEYHAVVIDPYKVRRTYSKKPKTVDEFGNYSGVSGVYMRVIGMGFHEMDKYLAKFRITA